LHASGTPFITRVSHQLALRTHPDKNPDNADATAQFQHVSEAYKILLRHHERSDRSFSPYGGYGYDGYDYDDYSDDYDSDSDDLDFYLSVQYSHCDEIADSPCSFMYSEMLKGHFSFGGRRK